ncbi:integrase [Streptomyces sp. NPDC057963]|uniref:integrase n=1 Tax=Streptomyces sp. NPDC057963 TaxID=3346290 RepID=UPI0036E7A098
MSDFRLYGLRYTVHAFSARSGATLKDTMARAEQSTEKAALIHQNSDLGQQKEVASGPGRTVQAAREGGVSSRRKA